MPFLYNLFRKRYEYDLEEERARARQDGVDLGRESPLKQKRVDGLTGFPEAISAA